MFCAFNRPLLREIEAVRQNPFPFQQKVFKYLLAHGLRTVFGHEHHLEEVSGIDEFRQAVPVLDYDRTEPYILSMLHGQKNVLWDRPIPWFAVSSGTSSAKSKFIPLSHAGLHQGQYKSMRMLLASYIDRHRDSGLFHGKTLTMGGSRQIDASLESRCSYGDLSAFLIKNNPVVSRWFSTPSKKIACCPDFKYKMELISKIIPHQDLRAFAGVPSWNLLLMEKILRESGRDNLHELWPRMELFMHGGINFEPYRSRFGQLFPRENMHYIETYNASEGFFAFQDDLNANGMLLLPCCGVFYEFVPVKDCEKLEKGLPVSVYTLDRVEKNVNYALIISTNSGLWRYLIGDTVKFVSLLPHRMVITGRTRSYINAFGEELMVHHAECALAEACNATGAQARDFTVAPVFMTVDKKGRHEWLIEFEKEPDDREAFVRLLDSSLCRHNSDYAAKRLETGTMDLPVVHILKPRCFFTWMEKHGKLGGQHKVPRLSPRRDFAEELLDLNASL